MLKHVVNAATTIVLVGVLTACATSTARTSIDRVAKAPDLKSAPYANLLIVGVGPRANLAREFELVLAGLITEGDTRATAYHRLASRADVSEDKIRELVERQGADAVLVTTLRHVDSEVRMRGARTELKAEPIGGSLVDFFRYDYKEYSTAPSADLKYNVQLVTDVFDAKSGDRVYTIESTTLQAETAYEIIDAESEAIAKQLREDDMLR